MKASSTKLDEQFFAQFGPFQRFKKGETIIRAGDEPAGIYYLKKGFVRLYLISADDKEITFNIYKPGTYFSMLWALGNIQNAYFFESISEVEVLKAPKDEVVKFLKSQPDILSDLTKRTLIGLDGTIKLMQALLTGTASQKVCAVLLVLTRRFGKKKKNGETLIQLPLTHKIIASLAGLTRETTSLELLKLRKEQTVAQVGHFITVKKPAKLEEESLIAQIERVSFLP